MPRDANGNYNLPNGSIVSAGQTIQPSQHNPALQDIGQALTNSLSRDGLGGMRGDLNFNGYSITNLGGLNLTGSFSASTVGTDAQYYMQVVQGSPRLNFDVDDYLLYNRGSNQLALWVGGSQVMDIRNGQLGTSAQGVLWGASNFTPAGKANVSGQVFTGTVAAPTIEVTGGGYYMGFLGANPRVNFDVDDYLLYDRSANALVAVMGGQNRLVIQRDGNMEVEVPGMIRLRGEAVAYGTRDRLRITDGTAAPSGGVNGDLYFQYT